MNVRWHTQPTTASLRRAGVSEIVDTLPVISVPVSQFTHQELPPSDDPRVQRELARIAAGKELRPLVAVRQAGRVHILDGHHRVVAVQHLDPGGTVRAVVATTGEVMNKKSMSRSERLAKAEEKFADALTDAQLAVDQMGLELIRSPALQRRKDC